MPRRTHAVHWKRRGCFLFWTKRPKGYGLEGPSRNRRFRAGQRRNGLSRRRRALVKERLVLSGDREASAGRNHVAVAVRCRTNSGHHLCVGRDRLGWIVRPLPAAWACGDWNGNALSAGSACPNESPKTQDKRKQDELCLPNSGLHHPAPGVVAVTEDRMPVQPSMFKTAQAHAVLSRLCSRGLSPWSAERRNSVDHDPIDRDTE